MRTPGQKMMRSLYETTHRARELKRAADRRYYERNRERMVERQRLLRITNPEMMRAIDQRKYEKNKENIKARTRAYSKRPERKEPNRAHAAEYRAANRELCNQRAENWRKRNRKKATSYVMKHHAAKMQAVPKWADIKAIELVYQKAVQFGFDVDHIVPLQSSLVCGLHTWDNLQLLHPSDNRSKANRIWPDMP